MGERTEEKGEGEVSKGHKNSEIQLRRCALGRTLYSLSSCSESSAPARRHHALSLCSLTVVPCTRRCSGRVPCTSGLR